MIYHQERDLSTYKRVFVVGDIHGEFGMLSDALKRVEFDPLRDALVAVGDLVDRGPDSEAALQWIDKPWFYRVLGNHDLVPRRYLDREISKNDVTKWGGEWLVEKSFDQIETIARRLEAAPTAMTVITPAKRRVGIVHADCLRDWQRHTAALDNCSDHYSQKWMRDFSLYSRETINQVRHAETKSIDPFDACTVVTIDHVFHGHTPLEQPLTVSNRSWIDTGACYGDRLTLVNVDDWCEYWHQQVHR